MRSRAAKVREALTDEFKIAAFEFAPGLQEALVVHPVNFAIEQDGVVEIGDFAIEPEMNAADGPVFELVDLAGQLFAPRCGRQMREQLGVASKGSARTRKSETRLPSRVLDGPLARSLRPTRRIRRWC